MDFSRIESWLQREDDELLYAPDGEELPSPSPSPPPLPLIPGALDIRTLLIRDIPMSFFEVLQHKMRDAWDAAQAAEDAALIQQFLRAPPIRMGGQE